VEDWGQDADVWADGVAEVGVDDEPIGVASSSGRGVDEVGGGAGLGGMGHGMQNTDYCHAWNSGTGSITPGYQHQTSDRQDCSHPL
jgi:hypothetical protein